MNSNYMFAFNRGRGPAPRSLDAAAPRSLDAAAPRSLDAPAPAPRSLASNRFSINRLINYKSAGGCRSCN